MQICHSSFAPNLWASISKNKINQPLVERAHGDGIKVSSESPEAFEECILEYIFSS